MFKIIESDQSYNVYRINIDRETKVEDVRYHTLVCSIPPITHIKVDGDNIIVNINCYDKDGLVINGYSNVSMELKCITRFINN